MAREIRILDDFTIPPEERVYVNRDLRLASIEAVGFDLDHTLAHYDPLSVGELAFSATKEKLVAKKGYPSEILSLPYDPDFVIRGLVVDLNRGNLLKMDYHNYVHRAFHGFKNLSSQERKRTYSSNRLLLGNGFASVDTLFHLPEVYLYLCLIDFFEARRIKVDYRALFQDVRSMIDLAHADGSIKNKVVAEPKLYLRGDRKVFTVLEKLREAGKKLFLLTNSETAYADALLSYLLAVEGKGGRWREWFDVVVTEAQKPAFFSSNLSPTSQVKEGGNGIHAGGNAYLLEEKLGTRADRIMYFGDHTYGDVLKAKKTMGWRTGMVVPELADEIAAAQEIRKAYNRLVVLSAQRKSAEQERASLQELGAKAQAARDEEHTQIYRTKRQVLERRIQRISEEIDTLESLCQFAYNSNWGSLFREGKQISRFGHQVRDFACVYTFRVSNLLNYPADFYFQTALDFMPHELML